MRYLLITVVLLALAGCTPQAEVASTPQPVPTGAPIDSAPAEPGAPGVGIKEAPTDPAARAALAAEAPAPVTRDGYRGVTFTELSAFPYGIDEFGKLLPDSKVPESISALDGQQVALSGFLVPIEFKDEKVSGLILVRNQLLCCYGEEPQLNEWVLVAVNPPVEPVTDVPVTFFGNFEASPDVEEEQVISLYRMRAVAMERMD